METSAGSAAFQGKRIPEILLESNFSGFGLFLSRFKSGEDAGAQRTSTSAAAAVAVASPAKVVWV